MHDCEIRSTPVYICKRRRARASVREEVHVYDCEKEACMQAQERKHMCKCESC
jgi:hypothetical protein